MISVCPAVEMGELDAQIAVLVEAGLTVTATGALVLALKLLSPE